ncbi:hypothetical protein SAY87_018158 [Trapa incisa]|uniref:non-specific serine/threonine protein kinase n=1 Tax=Trapa incisa TaxID=236973 RepID=A0AAN7L2Y7_9MYRT|nr:hypothetical protein SAY87_018158 [Trapa incisa]
MVFCCTLHLRIKSIALWILLLLLHTLGISSSGLVLESKDCLGDRIGYSVYEGEEMFFINGDLVDKSLFCDALLSYLYLCSLEELLDFSLCSLTSTSQVMLNLPRERKLLVEPDHGSLVREHQNPIIKTIIIAGIGVSALCFFTICSYLCWRRRQRGHVILPPSGYSSDSVSSYMMRSPQRFQPSPLRPMPSPYSGSNNWRFSVSPSPRSTRHRTLDLNFDQIIQATRNFSSSMRIGKGAFGFVYKGVLEDGHMVSIKRVKMGHFKDSKTEFTREVELLTKIDHYNLVKLLGFIDQGDHRLIITEYVPNGTLRAHLDGNLGRNLSFSERLAIAIDVAHGLTYLHMYSEKQIIHRDVKSSNILLTDTFRAKVADFGLARVGVEGSEQSHVNTAVRGTVGYLDPVYIKTHQLTAKSDVYSFGIVLLEILTGRQPVELSRPLEERVTLRWVFDKIEEGKMLDLVDPRMEEAIDQEVLMAFFQLAIQCAAPVWADRPDMKSVGKQLWQIRVEYLSSSRRS